MNPDYIFTQKLRKAVNEKIKSTWTKKKQVAFGDQYVGIEQIQNKDAFYLSICEDIDESLTKKFGLDQASDRIISKYSVGRFLDETYDKSFSDKNKDAFSIYLGYENYQDFCIKNLNESEKEASISIPKWHQNRVVLGILAFILLSGIVILYKSNSVDNNYNFQILSGDEMFLDEEIVIVYDLKDYEFTKAMFEVNGQVEFITKRSGTARFFIHNPGVKFINLRVDDKVLLEQKVFVKTKKWYASVNQTRPVYDDFIEEPGLLRLPPSAILPDLPESYGDFQFHDNIPILGDEMILETRVKNSEAMNGFWAYDVSIGVSGENSGFGFNLLHPDATQYARLFVADSKFETPAERAKLNKLGIDLSFWRDVKVILHDHVISIFVDKELILENAFEGELGELKGLMFYIKGRGAVDYIKISKLSGEVVFEDDFDAKAKQD